MGVGGGIIFQLCNNFLLALRWHLACCRTWFFSMYTGPNLTMVKAMRKDIQIQGFSQKHNV